MSGTLTVAYAELTRVLPWSLRALGYAFGIADRGAHLVATGASMNPAVLDKICQAGRRPAHRCLPEETPGLMVLDATNISLLEAGPAAMDALAARVDGDVWQRCRIAGATEPVLLPSVLVGGMDYNLCSIGIAVSDGGLAWHLAEPGSHGLLYSGYGRESLLELLAGNPASLEQIEAADLSQGSVLLIACAGKTELNPTGHASIRPREKIAVAYSKGIPISRQTLDALYALEVLTWAPTSERSRAQAGFTVVTAPSS